MMIKNESDVNVGRCKLLGKILHFLTSKVNFTFHFSTARLSPIFLSLIFLHINVLLCFTTRMLLIIRGCITNVSSQSLGFD